MEFLTVWHWLILSLLLIITETFIGIGYLYALGIAAGTTGLLVLLFNLSWEYQLTFFSAFCLSLIGILGYLLKIKAQKIESQLNQPIESLLGRTTTLTQIIENDLGKVYINGISWLVTGNELKVNTVVKVVSIKDGSLLIVEPILHC